MDVILYKEESYRLVGICMEIHNILGRGFSENVYKDALEYELKTNHIPFQREQKYLIRYKEIILPHKYYADFVVDEKIILEIKAIERFHSNHEKQCLNYLAASKLKLAILVNFGEVSLKYKRVVL
jgi:GxxExxY protein